MEQRLLPLLFVLRSASMSRCGDGGVWASNGCRVVYGTGPGGATFCRGRVVARMTGCRGSHRAAKSNERVLSGHRMQVSCCWCRTRASVYWASSDVFLIGSPSASIFIVAACPRDERVYGRVCPKRGAGGRRSPSRDGRVCATAISFISQRATIMLSDGPIETRPKGKVAAVTAIRAMGFFVSSDGGISSFSHSVARPWSEDGTIMSRGRARSVGRSLISAFSGGVAPTISATITGETGRSWS